MSAEHKLLALCVIREGSRGGKYPAENWWLLQWICKQQPQAAVHLVIASTCALNSNGCIKKNINLQRAVRLRCHTSFSLKFYYARHLRNFGLSSLVPIRSFNPVLFNLVSVCRLIRSPRLSPGRTIKTLFSLILYALFFVVRASTYSDVVRYLFYCCIVPLSLSLHDAGSVHIYVCVYIYGVFPVTGKQYSPDHF